MTAYTSATLPPPPTHSPTPTTPITLSAEDQVNAIGADAGWESDDPSFGSAADMVQSVCDNLASHEATRTLTSVQWLGAQHFEPTDQKVIRGGVPLLCPRWKSVVTEAFGGAYARPIDDGTWKVTSKPGDDNITPGTYRAKGDLRDCYWERTATNGDIIDNRYATAASSITVTIKASDDTFTSRNCGTWQQVR